MEDRIKVQPGGSLAPQLRYFLATQVFLTLACAVTELYCKVVLHLKGEFTSPFLVLEQKQPFGDFTLFTSRFEHFHSQEFFAPDTLHPFMYPAPVAVLYKIFFSYHAHPLLLFLSFVLGSFLVAVLLLGLSMRKRGVRSIVVTPFLLASWLMAFPFWFDFKQGNIEIAVWTLVTIGVWAFYKGKGYASATCFGIAGSMKFFPFVYLGLLLSKRKYSEAVFAGVVGIFTTLASLWLVGGRNISNSWHQIESGLGKFKIIYMLHYRPDESGFDHSLFSIYKRIWHHLSNPDAFHLTPPEIKPHILTLYLAVAAVSGIALYFIRIRRLPILNQVLCLCIASIMLPPVSYEYTLMHLYVPFGLLASFAQERWKAQDPIPGLTAALLCLAVLLSPLSELILRSAGSGGQLKAVFLVVLMYIGLKYPFGSAREPSIPAEII